MCAALAHDHNRIGTAHRTLTWVVGIGRHRIRRVGAPRAHTLSQNIDMLTRAIHVVHITSAVIDGCHLLVTVIIYEHLMQIRCCRALPVDDLTHDPSSASARAENRRELLMSNGDDRRVYANEEDRQRHSIAGQCSVRL
jgi:hypothetical protein